MEKLKVLLVEDDAVARANIIVLLDKLDHQAVQASSGDEAIKKALEEKPDVIMMDIGLNEYGIDGITAYKEISSRLDVPVIYISSHSENSTVKRAMKTEPYGFLIKPFELETLKVNIEMTLYKYKISKELKENRMWLQTILNGIGDAVVATDPVGKIKFFNPSAEKLTGLKRHEAIDKNIKELFDIIDEQKSVSFTQNELILEDELIDLNNNVLLVTKDSKRIPVRENATPIKDEAGNIIGMVLIFYAKN